MDNKKFGNIEDLLDLTDSESSSSSNPGVFESYQPFVLELHELKKDEPTPDTQVAEAKAKKHKKKKRGQLANKSATSASSSSPSEGSVVPSVVDDAAKEEFYDAHESYHALPENQTSNPVAAAALMQAHSEHGQDPKLAQGQSAPSQATSVTRRETSSTISKPVNPPE